MKNDIIKYCQKITINVLKNKLILHKKYFIF